MLHLENFSVWSDPTFELFPGQHFPGGLLVQKRNQNLPFLRLFEPESTQRRLGESKSRQSHAASNHLPPRYFLLVQALSVWIIKPHVNVKTKCV